MVVRRRDLEDAKTELEFDRRLAYELLPVCHPARRHALPRFIERLEALIGQHFDPWLVKLLAGGGKLQHELRRLPPLPPRQRPSKGLPPSVRPLLRELVTAASGRNGNSISHGDVVWLTLQAERLLEEVKLRTPLGAALRN